MLSQEIRRNFLAYYKKKGHTIVPSSSVAPADDPTLLFINAGMNQFKDLFLGKSTRDYKRATSSQKCIRVGGKHNDLENVGHTSRHLTFFEMLGNFSFGDYFKKEAIEFAWEVSTAVFGFDPERIWVTVFREDDEAEELWTRFVPKTRICRFDEKDNFWMMGDTGPCGPCSELLYDRGAEWGNFTHPSQDPSGERFLEFWNLVFMQFDRLNNGQQILLPKPSIDTGAGLERVVSLKMGKQSVFETDILRSIIAQVEQLSCKAYPGASDPHAAAFHVIADHLRSLSFAIADGVQPSNTDRGYILRKLVRRAVRYGRTLGFDKPFLGRVLPRLIETMGDDFHELKESQSRIAEILETEEHAFFATLRRGSHLLNDVLERSKAQKSMSGEDAFKLKDTYGLPLEEITLVAKDHHVAIDLERYAQLEKEAKERSRKERKESGVDTLQREHDLSSSTFVRDAVDPVEARILHILQDGQEISSLQAGQEAVIVLDKSPFYAEKGGQVGDTGLLSTDSAEFTVEDAQWHKDRTILHKGLLTRGSLQTGQTLHATINKEQRLKIANNHTATHLMHWAIQQVVGPHVRQAGSLVDSERLRFDFNHHKALSKEECWQIEDLVNAKIRANLCVMCYEKSYADVQQDGQIKQFFGDKYGSIVRVVDIVDSKELCGGTHTDHTGNIGYFRIVSEASVAAGVRRIEAVTGDIAEKMARSQEETLLQLADVLKTPLNNIIPRCHQLNETIRQQQEQLQQWQQKHLQQVAEKIVEQQSANGVVASVEAGIDLRLLGGVLKGKMKGMAILIQNDERCNILVQGCQDTTLDANVILQSLLKEIQGKGGGRKDCAQGSAPRCEQIDHLLHIAKKQLCS